jgi:bacterioferritin (cytochrome b1)
MRTVSRTHRSKVIELLSERLAFERASVKLYEAILQRLRPRGGPFESVQARLRLIREEEKSHQEWLEEQVRTLGGDPELETDGSLLVRAEWRRIAEDSESDHEPARLFQALLNAELFDNAGWELLVELADRAQDEEARDAFLQRLHEEQEHLLFVSHLASVFARNEVLDTTVDALESAGA